MKDNFIKDNNLILTMGLKTDLSGFHKDIILLLEFISEDDYFRRLVGKETIQEYEYLETQVKEFREKLSHMSGQDKKILELNVSLKMLSYTLHEYVTEIKSGRITDKKKLAKSLSFITKFIAQSETPNHSRAVGLLIRILRASVGQDFFLDS